MQIDQFAVMTRSVIRDQGFEGFQPTACYPERRSIRALSGVPANEAHEPIALRWAASLAMPGEEYFVAFKHSTAEFKIVHCLHDGQEESIYAADV